MARGKKSRKTESPIVAPQAAVGPAPKVAIALGVILAAYLALAIPVAVIVPHDPTPEPRLTPPDESAHWLFVRELATDGRLPVFKTDGSNYEAHQPPLYYVSVLWAYLIAGDGGLVLGRLWSVLLGGLTLLALWRLSGVLLGGERSGGPGSLPHADEVQSPPPAGEAGAPHLVWLRLAAVAALAFLPGRLFIVSSVSNDALFELLSVVTLWQALVAVKDGMDLRRAAVLGACLGLSLLTKTSALVLCPIVALAVLLEPRWRRQGLGSLLGNAAVIAALCGGLWGWWVARNMTLYHEPLAVDVFQRVFLKDRPTPEFFLSRGATWTLYWLQVGSQAWMSLWGVFGQATVYMPRLFYDLGRLIAAAMLVGAVLAWYRATRGAEAPFTGPDKSRGSAPPGEPDEQTDRWRARPEVLSWALAALLVVLTLGTFMRFNMVFYQAQARYFLGVSGVLACLLAAGVCGLAPRSATKWPALGLAIVLFAMALWSVVAHATGGYSFLPPGLAAG